MNGDVAEPTPIVGGGPDMGQAKSQNTEK